MKHLVVHSLHEMTHWPRNPFGMKILGSWTVDCLPHLVLFRKHANVYVHPTNLTMQRITSNKKRLRTTMSLDRWCNGIRSALYVESPKLKSHQIHFCCCDADVTSGIYRWCKHTCACTARFSNSIFCIRNLSDSCAGKVYGNAAVPRSSFEWC